MSSETTARQAAEDEAVAKIVDYWQRNSKYVLVSDIRAIISEAIAAAKREAVLDFIDGLVPMMDDTDHTPDGDCPWAGLTPEDAAVLAVETFQSSITRKLEAQVSAIRQRAGEVGTP